MRYAAAPPRAYYRADFDEDHEESITADAVIDSDWLGGIDTGLVNADGWPICRVREPIGFDLTGK